MQYRMMGRSLFATGVMVAAVCNVTAAASLPIVRQFPAPGPISEGMAFVGDDLWVWDIDGPNTFYVLDPLSGAVLATHPSPFSQGIAALAFDGASLWAASSTPEPGYLARLSPLDGSVVTYYNPPVYEPTGIAFDGQHLWIPEWNTARILRVDPSDMSILTTLLREPLFSTNISWDGATLWLGGYEPLSEGGLAYWIRQIDPETGATLATYTPPGRSVTGLTIHDGSLYVSDVTTGTVHVLRLPEPATALLFLVGAWCVASKPLRASYE